MKKDDEEIKIKDFRRNITNITTKPSVTNQYTINYVTDKTSSFEFNQTTDSTIGLESFEQFDEVENNVSFPIYLSDYRCIQIPKGIRRSVKRLPKKILKKIDNNLELAIEKCFLFVSNLTYSVFREDDCWKSLSSKVLHNQLKKGSDNTYVYKNIIEALSYCTNSTLPIIECKKNENGKDSYQEGSSTKQYRFNYSFRNQNLEKIDIKFKKNLDKRLKYHRVQFGKAIQNPIGKNLINVYPQITLPNEDEIIQKGKELVKLGYKNKKGKVLTFLNKKPKSYYSNFQNRTFVEENLKQFEYLVGNNFLIPKVGDYKSGGRVVDSFNLMPSWIRSMVEIDSEPIVELDFKALHPNIAMAIYGGVEYKITHQQVAKDLNRPISEIKIEHLSFFNKRINDMKRSPLFEYYFKREKDILKRIIDDKQTNNYKITSQKLFKKEVEIMTTCIKELDNLDIYVLYVYDALYCKFSDKIIVKEVMNRSLIKHSIYTSIG